MESLRAPRCEKTDQGEDSMLTKMAAVVGMEDAIIQAIISMILHIILADFLTVKDNTHVEIQTGILVQVFSVLRTTTTRHTPYETQDTSSTGTVDSQLLEVPGDRLHDVPTKPVLNMAKILNFLRIGDANSTPLVKVRRRHESHLLF